jgi:xanthine dehydrogenase molybdopterin-binding subunit B
VEGVVKIGGQNHFAMEKQGCYILPKEDGQFTVYSGVQGPEVILTKCCLWLGGGLSEGNPQGTPLPRNQVEVVSLRAGGGFGSRCTHTFWPLAAACIAVNVTGKPVKIQNAIGVDMAIGGNCRHPSDTRYKVGCDAEGKILAADFFADVDAGAGSDLSFFCAGELKNNLKGVYNIPNVQSNIKVYKTQTGSNTAVRGPGLLQACMVMEHVVQHLATKHGMEPTEMRLKNLIDKNSETLLGAPMGDVCLPEIVEKLMAKSDFAARKEAVNQFNAENKWKKRGIEFTPAHYGLTHSFAAGTMCTINVHSPDGSITVWHSGAEIGQGLNAKVVGAIAGRLGVDHSTIQCRETNTSVSVNGGLTGGSVMSEALCHAALQACDILLERLKPVKEFMTAWDGPAVVGDGSGAHPFGLPQETLNAFGGFITAEAAAALQTCGPPGQEPTWQQMIMFGKAGFFPCDLQTNLSATGVFVPKGKNNLDFIMNNNLQGQNPASLQSDTSCFSALATAKNPTGHELVDYFCYGGCVSEVEIDLLTGAKNIIRVDLVQDVGNSLNAQIDIGQTEGAFLMGVAFMCQEEVLYDHQTGYVHSQDTWEYKPPLCSDIPHEWNVELHNLAPENKLGINYCAGSKAVGEPPILLACSVLSAIKSAITASRVERGLSPEFELNVPASVDRIQQALELDSKDFVLDAQA